MAEKTTLLDKLPTIASNNAYSSKIEPNSAQPPAPEIFSSQGETLANMGASKTKDTFSTIAHKVNAVESQDLATNTVGPNAEITITMIDSVTYYGLFALFLFFLLSAITVFSKRAQITASAPQKALFFGGFGLITLSAYTFASQKLFASFLNQTIDAYPLWLKPVSWALIAPLLLLTIPYLVTESPKAHRFFFKCALKAAASFLMVGALAFADLNVSISATLTTTAVGLGVFFTLPLVKAIRRLPGSLTADAKSQISQLSFTIIGMILAQLVSGILAVLSIAVTLVLFIDVVLSFALMTMILIKITGYVSIQSPKREAA